MRIPTTTMTAFPDNDDLFPLSADVLTVLGLDAGGSGWPELLDDLAAGLGHLDWWQLDWTSYNKKNGSTRPAINR